LTQPGGPQEGERGNNGEAVEKKNSVILFLYTFRTWMRCKSSIVPITLKFDLGPLIAANACFIFVELLFG